MWIAGVRFLRVSVSAMTAAAVDILKPAQCRNVQMIFFFADDLLMFGCVIVAAAALIVFAFAGVTRRACPPSRHRE